VPVGLPLSGSWRWCAIGSPESTGLASSPSVCRRCTLWGCPSLCQWLSGSASGGGQAAACNTALRTMGSSQLAAAEASAAARPVLRAAAAALSETQSRRSLPVALVGTVVSLHRGAHCCYWAGSCRGGCSVGGKVRVLPSPMALVSSLCPLNSETQGWVKCCASQTERG
jgi:hypothetical protein